MSPSPQANTSYVTSHNGEFGNAITGVLGTGLIEITALTTLIGSNTAEQLALGNRGATGLAWMVMSTFGTLSVIKACVAASTPSWLRETLGVRNAMTDAAVGLSLDLSSVYMDMVRRNLGEAIGVTCERRRVSDSSPYLGY
jgi:hypothetical protein